MTAVYQILSESAKFHSRYDKNISAYFLLEHAIGILTKHDLSFTRFFRFFKTLFRSGAKYYNKVVTNILRNKNTNDYKNWSVFTELFEK